MIYFSHMDIIIETQNFIHRSLASFIIFWYINYRSAQFSLEREHGEKKCKKTWPVRAFNLRWWTPAHIKEKRRPWSSSAPQRRRSRPRRSTRKSKFEPPSPRVAGGNIFMLFFM